MAVGWHITNRADMFGRPGGTLPQRLGASGQQAGRAAAAGQDSPRAGFAKGRFPAKAGHPAKAGLRPRWGFRPRAGASGQGGASAKGGGFRQGGAAQGRGIHGSRRRGYGMAVPGPARGGVCLARGECAAGSHNKIQMEEIRK